MNFKGISNNTWVEFLSSNSGEPYPWKRCPTTFFLPSNICDIPSKIQIDSNFTILGFWNFQPKLLKVSFFPAIKAAFDHRQCLVSLFGGDGGSGSYMCSQSVFVLDILFNPDPSVTPSEPNCLLNCQISRLWMGPHSIKWFFISTIEVPLRQASINDIGDRYYGQPSPYHGTLTVAVPPDWIEQSCDKSRAKPISPPENLLAFLLWLGFNVAIVSSLAVWLKL